MRATKHLALAVVVIAMARGRPSFAQRSDAQIQLQRTIPLAGVEGRIDHLAFDAIRERLFVCALGNNSVEAIDLRKGERIYSVTGLSSPQGVAYAPELDRLFVANGKDGSLKMFDGTSFKPIGDVGLGDDADNLRYDNAAKKVYAGFGSGGIAIVNAATGKQVGSIKLTGHPEAFVLENHGNRMFVNVPPSHVAAIDREKNAVVANWSTGWVYQNFPMTMDETTHRLFIGCRLPSKLVILNSESGDTVAKVAITGDSDDLFYDSKRHRIYAICGAGKIDVIDQVDANTYKAASQIETAEGARTGCFAPDRDELFVAVPHRGSQRAEIRCYHVK